MIIGREREGERERERERDYNKQGDCRKDGHEDGLTLVSRLETASVCLTSL
jgi:hypothetical protein